MVLLDGFLRKFILQISKEIQIESESGVTQSIIDELHSSYIQLDQMEDESGVTGFIIDEHDSWGI